MALRMAMANKSGKTDRSMMVNGKEIKLMAKEHLFTQMEIYMRANG